jgi:hypothetical protein
MANIYDMVDTWNNGSTTFTSIKMNVADINSANDSLLIDLQVDSNSKFNVDKDGNIVLVGTVDGRDIAADGSKLDNIAPNATENTVESIQDIVGAMTTLNTETLITVTYQDADGTLDFVVDNDLANYDNTNSGFISDYTVTEGDVTAHQAALSIATTQLTGDMPNARIVASNVTQHQAALSVTESQISDLGNYEVIDPAIIRADVSDTLEVGYNATAYNAGTQTTGTFTPNPALGNFQYTINGGAHTLAPPATDCSIVIQYTNNASAGAITTTGFTQAVVDELTTTDGDDFLFMITRCNGFSLLTIKALQ